jgi:ribonuclease R
MGVGSMDVRDVVRIKKGVGGLDPPTNLGILLDREKDGKDHVAIVFTLSGKLRIRWGSLKEPTGSVYEGDKTDERAMTEFLRYVIKRHESKNMLHLDPQVIIDTLKPMDLWSSVIAFLAEADRPISDEGPCLSPLEIGRIHYEPYSLDPRQLRAVERVLATCNDPREPYFKRFDLEGKAGYVPYPAGVMERIEAHSILLESLKTAFVRWEDEELEDGRIVSHPVPRSDDIRVIVPAGELGSELERVCTWGLAFLESGRWPERPVALASFEGSVATPVGLAGSPVRKVRKFDLERFLAFFFKDLPMSRSDDLASNILLTLLKLKRISWRKASDLVVQYKIASGAQKFHRTFPTSVLERSGKLPGGMLGPDMIGRSDLRDLETYTIDPPDAKDFDDAVSVVPDSDGYTVYVHIADVTHYVRPDDPIDSEARFRATSVYLPSGVLPMLPPKLSENLCSLRQDEDRLAVTAEIRIGPDHDVRTYSFLQSVIRVRRNLAYSDAEGFIREGREPFATLDRISQGLRSKCRRLDLQTPERRVRFECDDEISAVLKRATASTVLIEELMVLANECASRFLESRGIKTAFRVHPIPERDGLDRFNAACKVLGHDIKIEGKWARTPSGQPQEGLGGGEDAMLKALMSGGKLSIGSFSDAAGGAELDSPPKAAEGIDKARMDSVLDEMNRALEKVHALPDEWMRDLLSATLLRCMPRAFYSTENIGHFGLRSGSYCHFTSPIRRYADDLVHRAIKAVLAIEGKGPEVPWGIPSEEEVALMTESINEMSDDAESWERQMVDAAQATRIAMAQKEVNLSGRITSITPAACYVTFDDGLTEGRLPIRAMSRYRLTSDPDGSMIYLNLEENMDQEFDPKLMRQLSTSGGEIVAYRLGDRVVCSVYSVSIAEGRLELALRRNGSESIIPYVRT